MVVVVLFGIGFAILAMLILFLLMFIDVAFQTPHAGLNRTRNRVAESAVPATLTGASVYPQQVTSESTSSATLIDNSQRSTYASTESTVTTISQLILSRHARHLRTLTFLIAIGGALVLFIRHELVPEAFGDRGPYRGAALAQIALQPSVLTTDASCLKCHANVGTERATSPHQAVRCMHCHGNGHEHIAAAVKAAESPGTQIPPAVEWDGDFLTGTDLFITHDRATCLSCHTSVVGMPSSFRSIDVDRHLEEQGAENINDRNVCFECHTGHSPGI